MSASQYLLRRGKWFHFRLRIPRNVAGSSASTYIYLPLRTQSFDMAKHTAKYLGWSAGVFFHQLKGHDMDYRKIRNLAKKWLQEKLDNDEAKRFAFGPEPRPGTFEPETMATLNCYTGKAERALRDKDYTFGAHQAQCLLFEKNIKMDEDSPEFRTLAFELVKAMRERFKITMERNQGAYENFLKRTVDEMDGVLPSVSNPVEPTPTKQQPTLAEVINRFLEEKKSGEGWTSKTYLENKSMLELLQEIIGSETQLVSIKHDDLLRFRDTMRKLPANHRKRQPYRDKSIPEILAMDGIKPLDLTTVNNKLVKITAFFKWAFNREIITHNPAHDLLLTEKERPSENRECFSDEELSRIFKLLPAVVKHPKERPERIWIPLIALFSGMRLNEICQLHCADIQQIEKIWCFNVNANSPDQRLKTPDSKRVIPLHPMLVKAGLINYAAGFDNPRDGRLWQNLSLSEHEGYGKGFGRWYNENFNRRHITQETVKTFHSFRHTFATCLKNAGAEPLAISELMGHAVQGETFGRYAKRFSIANLAAEIEKLKFPTLDLVTTLKACKATYAQS